MRMAWLSILIVLLLVSPAFGQRDAPVWESYLPKLSIYSDGDNARPAITVDFVFKKNGGPHEHTEHQAYILVYLKKDEEQILKLAADPELTKKKNEKTKSFLDVLVEKKLVVPLDSQVAKINRDVAVRYEDVRGNPRRVGAESIVDFGFPFKFTFTNDTLFKSVQKLGNFRIESVDVAGSSTWFEDKFKLMVLVPVNDSALATKVPAKLHEMYDFASLMNFETSLLYFRPLPYEFGFKRYSEDRLLIYIN
ncbi:MAG TPA: hypothetical protein VFI24_02320 [Pyrinomonadaceae bacterium]|nr:hypothetical protein [Pyrinomonadaceae bacterium]